MREELEEIYRAADRAASLTRQLLAFSRRQVLQPEVLDLNAVITDVQRMLRRMRGSDIELAAVLDPEAGRIKADPVQLEQVLMNLTLNAQDAMREGGRLRIETRSFGLAHNDSAYPHMLPGQYALLSVSDNGCGMEPGTLERMFEPFFTTKPSGKGTGLGLSTVYGIVKQSGGYIWTDSVPGEGTTFRIYFPVVTAEPAPVSVTASSSVATRGSETILLAEDDSAVRRLARRSLERQGYTVIEAANGDEALRLFELHGHTVSLLLTDLVMPLMGGRELAARIKTGHADLPVIFMSGYTDEAVFRSEVFEHGTAFVQKPFAPDALTQQVRSVLDSAGGR